MSLSVCLWCLNLQALARLMNGPVAQAPPYKHSTVVHVVGQMVQTMASMLCRPRIESWLYFIAERS